jgi:hypothetical protein
MQDAARTRELRLRAQRLSGARQGGVEEVARGLVGIQAQELAFARFAFRPRAAPALRAEDVDAALRAGALVWTWAMRGTLHLVHREDAGWLIGLLGPIFAARGRPRRLALGLDDARCERALEILRDVLAAEGPQTRAALAARLPIDANGQAPAHLMGLAALRGVVSRALGDDGGREPAYVLRDEPPAAVDEEHALAELARRYLAGHGPATIEDLAAWSGIGLRRARRALTLIEGELRPDAGGWALTCSPARVRRADGPQVALLGHFDPYLLGYASRDLVLDPRFAKRIQAGGGFIAPAVVVDGRVAGTWRRDRLEFFAPPADDVAALADRELADVERFTATAA